MSGNSRTRLYGIVAAIAVVIIAMSVAGWALFIKPSSTTGTEVTPSSDNNPQPNTTEIQKPVDNVEKEVNREKQLFVIQTYAACVTNDYYSYSEQSKVDCREEMNLANSYCDQYHFSICDEAKRAEFKSIVLNAGQNKDLVVGIAAGLGSVAQEYFITLELLTADGRHIPGDGKAVAEFVDTSNSRVFFKREFVVSHDDPIANSDSYGYYQFNIPFAEVPVKMDKFKAQVTYIQTSDGKQFSNETEIYCNSDPC